MANETFFHQMEAMSADENFRAVTRITSQGRKIQKHLEYVTRFIVFLNHDFDSAFDVEEFIDKEIINIADDVRMVSATSKAFDQTFELLRRAAGTDALRRYDPSKGRFTGQVGQVALEAVAIGVARNLEAIQQLSRPDDFVRRRIREFWSAEDVSNFSRAGLSGGKRLSATLPFGAEFFEP